MFGVLARPKTEAIVMLGRENKAFHPGGHRHRSDLIGIEGRWVEHAFAFVPETPLAIGKGVHGEMNKAVKLHLVPTQLALSGYRAKGLGWQGAAGRSFRGVQCKV